MFFNRNKIPNNEIDKDLFKFDDERDNTILNATKSNSNVKVVKKNKKEKKEKEVKDLSITDIKNKKTNKLLFIVIIVLLLLFSFSLIDVILVTRYNHKPIFAINTKTYKDGGTKEYQGIVYKVIDYNITNGRSDIVIGGLDLKYSDDAIKTSVLDLAISYYNDFYSFKNNYLNEYLEVEGTVNKIDKNKVTIAYIDEDKKYTTYLECDLNDKKLEINSTIKVKGILDNYEKDKDLNLYLSNCHVK